MESTLIYPILALGIVGIMNTMYLSYHVITKTPVKCIGFPDEWCEKVQLSKYSKMFHIPNPVLGLLMYVAISLLAILFILDKVSFFPISIIVCIGFTFSVYFTIVQAAVLKAYCTWCVLSAIDFLVLYLLVVITWVR